MATHTIHQEKNGIYFVTFTCYKWLPLIAESNAYDAVYRSFYPMLNYTKLLGYVIMPNHVHLLIYLESKKKKLNQIIGTLKRFIAYDIIKKLKKQGKSHLLMILQKGVAPNERRKNKKHQVFRLSFDAKLCESEEAIIEILSYIHTNPVKKWSLVDDFANYAHSSAVFYVLDKPVKFPVTHYADVFESIFKNGVSV